MRRCGYCDRDITDRPTNARYCTDTTCLLARKQQAGRESWARCGDPIRAKRREEYATKMAARPPKIRLCRFCGSDISHRPPKSIWCDMRCRGRARHQSPERRAHRFNAYAARVQRDAGLAVDPPISRADWERALPTGAQCAYCDADATEPDHVIPLSRGGRHDVSNIVPSCMPCNRSKQNATPEEWLGQRRYRR